jgi:opacity protein-like surface antigen
MKNFLAQMNLCLLQTFMLLLSFNTVMAQKGFHLGFGGGVTSAWILNQNNARTLEDYEDIAKSELAYKLKFGYQLGGILGYNLTKNYGIQLQVSYEKTGQDYEDNFTPNAGPLNVVRNIDLSYISLPVLFKYTSTRATKIKAYALAGVQFNFLTNAKEEVYLNQSLKPDSLMAFDKFNHFDFGFALGGGADIFFLNNFYLNIGIYNYIGISDINSDAVKDFISKNDKGYKGSKNFRSGLNIGLHYLFIKRVNSPWGQKTKNTFKFD